MSTLPPPGVPLQPGVAAQPAASPETRTIKLISHSMLFYWWPIWVIGFVLGLLTCFDDDRLVIVPPGTTVTASEDGAEPTYTLKLTHKQPTLKEAAEASKNKPAFPTRISRNKDYGIVFVLLLLMVIFITNVPMRGLWSVFVLMLLLLVIVLFAFLQWWGPIFEALGSLQIYISAEGYLVTATVLFIMWAVVVLIYDQRRFISFTAGQVIVHQEVGDMQQVYDTTNVQVEKLRSDLFRHWLLGFGSGDLIIQFPGLSGTQTAPAQRALRRAQSPGGCRLDENPACRQ